jgi:hypothetical protein
MNICLKDTKIEYIYNTCIIQGYPFLSVRLVASF